MSSTCAYKRRALYECTVCMNLNKRIQLRMPLSLGIAFFLQACYVQLIVATINCPNGYEWVHSSCLRFNQDDKVAWEVARRRCENEGAHLAIMDTVTKRNAVLKYMFDQNIIDAYWLDGREPYDNGNWQWYSKMTPVDKSIWLPGEPNDHTSYQDCMQFYDRYGTWGINDDDCEVSYPFICEKDSTDGSWGAWKDWEACSVTCGQGMKSRLRACDNPSPVGIGKNCSGSDRQTDICYQRPCPVDGAWGRWGHWSLCSVTCGNGTRTRHRECNDPPKIYGGKECLGEQTREEICIMRGCPVDGGWSSYGPWSTCSKTCGDGLMVRNRSCSDPTPQHGGQLCPGDEYQRKQCNLKHCPVDGGWNMWTHWSDCSASCGQGTRARHRACNDPVKMHGGKDCQGENVENEKCNTRPCPVDGGWAVWGNWSTCSVSCGGGTRVKLRSCTDPKPEHGGKDCPFNAKTQSEMCHLQDCPTCQVHIVPGSTMSVLSTNRLRENDYVRYYCEPEHTLISGSSTRTCLANGTLTGEEPVCQKCCGKASFILNGRPDKEHSLCYGDTVNYLCGEGYKSSNSTPIVCSSPYEWKYIPLPKCEPDGHCDISNIRAPENGFAACSGSELDKVCYIRCDEGYTYMSERAVHECGPQTKWEWMVRSRNRAYLRAEDGVCEATAGKLVNILKGITGPKITMASLESDEKLKQKIISEMKKELHKLNVCTDPCEIKDIQVERKHGSFIRRAISQTKLFQMTINLYAAVPDGPLTTQQSAIAALSKNLKHLSTQAEAIKSALVSQTISLQIDGVTVPVKGDNIRISQASFECSRGSIRKMFNCLTCPEGTYHDVDEEKCAACPFGQYQDEAGQLTCKQCPNDTTTDRIGVKNVSKCRTYEGCSCGIHPCILNGTDFICDCLPGYEANVNGTCTDVNECLEDVCPDNARCVNKEGSYRCECLPGFQGGSCVDIDECNSPNPCPSSGMQCINTVGSFNCTCSKGLYGDNCDKDCPDKFTLIGNTCQHISEGQANFSKATYTCTAIYPGAHLVDIKDKGAFKALTGLLPPDKSYWIGLNDISTEDDFVYSDGSKMTAYNEWGAGNTLPPFNDPTKNCVIIDGPAAFMWRVVDCSGKHYAICELQRV